MMELTWWLGCAKDFAKHLQEQRGTKAGALCANLPPRSGHRVLETVQQAL